MLAAVVLPPTFRARPFGPARVLLPPNVGLGAVLARARPPQSAKNINVSRLRPARELARGLPARAMGEAVGVAERADESVPRLKGNLVGWDLSGSSITIAFVGRRVSLCAP